MTRAAQNMSITALYPGVSAPLPALLGGARFVMRNALGTHVHGRPTWLIEMFVDGEMEVQIAGDAWHRFSAGEGVLYAPNTQYRERTVGVTCRSVVVFFDPGQDEMFAPLQTAAPYRLLEDRLGTAADLMQRVVDDLAAPGPQRLAAVGSLYQVLAMLLQAAAPGPIWRLGTSAAKDDLASATLRYMHANLDRPIQVADMAEHACLTPSGFAHAYRKLTGSTPMRDLRRLRVEAVKVHLLENRMTLAQVAEQTGFADAFHLSHVFRQVVGMSPQQFRRQR